MPSSYPAAIDTFTSPTAGDALSSAVVPHAAQHANANDAIKAIETLLGANGVNYVSVAGAQTISGAKTFTANASFGSTTRQMLNLFGTEYGIGVQAETVYFRTGVQYRWYKGGVHADASADPGAGGAALMGADTAGQVVDPNGDSSLQIRQNNVLKRVHVGAADSAGVGFRTLRVAN